MDFYYEFDIETWATIFERSYTILGHYTHPSTITHVMCANGLHFSVFHLISS